LHHSLYLSFNNAKDIIVGIKRRKHKCKRGTIQSSHWTKVLQGREGEADLEKNLRKIDTKL
jgi:hypothetical protein